MTLKLAKKTHILSLVLCVVWLVLGIFSFIENDGLFSKYSYLFVGLLYLGMVVYNYRRQYGKLENDVLVINGWKSKQLDLTKLTEVSHFAGDLILKSNQQQVTIGKNTITPDSFAAVENNEYVQAVLAK